MRWIMLVMLASLLIAFYWESLPFISNSVHAVLSPTLGKLLAYNHYIGMVVVALALNLIVVLLQKYTIDKETMKEIKAEQKELKEEMKKHKDNPDKMMEVNKRQMDLVFRRSMPLVMRPVIFTAVPFILLFRWFHDFYGPGGLFEGTIFLGFMNWFWFYFVLTIIFSQIFRKWFDVI